MDQVHSEQAAVAQGYVPPPLERLVVYGNPSKDGVAAVLVRLANWARERGIGLSVADDLAPLAEGAGLRAELYPTQRNHGLPLEGEEATLLVCLGGDGTLLHAARRFWPLKAPVLAVNLGMISFNASVDPGQELEVIEQWQAGQTRLSERMMLKVRQRRGDKVIQEGAVLNDVVLSKQIDSRLIHLTLSQGREQVASFAADGLIVATATGSTAYNLSAGGPIVFPTLRVMIVTAICPHTLTARPVILPAEQPVWMQFVPHHGRRQAVVWLDGQEEWPINPEDRIEVEAEPEALRLIVREDFEYFCRLRRKLSWSGDISDARDPRVSQ